jgi:hypothetical protein
MRKNVWRVRQQQQLLLPLVVAVQMLLLLVRLVKEVLQDHHLPRLLISKIAVVVKEVVDQHM